MSKTNNLNNGGGEKRRGRRSKKHMEQDMMQDYNEEMATLKELCNITSSLPILDTSYR